MSVRLQVGSGTLPAAPIVRQVIVVVTRNSEAVVKESVRSLIANTVGPVSVILWDDKSKDDTPDWLIEFARTDGRMTVVDSRVRLGVEGAFQAALSLFGSPTMYTLARSDVLWPYGWNSVLQKLYRSLFPYGTLSPAWDNEADNFQFDGPGVRLLDTEGQPVVQICRKLNRFDPPAVMVARDVYESPYSKDASGIERLGMPEEVGTRYDLAGRAARVAHSVRCRRIPPEVLAVAAAGGPR